MELGFEKCRTQAIFRGRFSQQEPFITSNNESITAMNAGEVYKYLGITQGIVLDHVEIKTKVKDDVAKRLKQLLKTSLNAGNLSSAINTYVIPVITFTLGVIKWYKTDLDNLERLIRVQMSRYRYHHPKSAVERIHVPRKLGGRGIINISGMHQRTISKMRAYFYEKLNSSCLLKAVLSADDEYTPLNLANRYWSFRQFGLQDEMNAWKQKSLHGRYPAELEDPSVDYLWSTKWLTLGYLYPETEGFIIAIQDQVIKTRNYAKYIINDPAIQTDNCRVCGLQAETIQHIIAGCSTFATTEYKTRHDNVARAVHKALMRKYCSSTTNYNQPTHMYQPLNVFENNNFTVYWDRSILTDRTTHHNRPDITVWNKLEAKVWLIDITVVNTNNLQTAYQTKISKYAELRRIITEQWRVNAVIIVPIVISATGVVPITLEKSLRTLNLPANLIIEIQKIVLLNTCSTVRKAIGQCM